MRVKLKSLIGQFSVYKTLGYTDKFRIVKYASNASGSNTTKEIQYQKLFQDDGRNDTVLESAAWQANPRYSSYNLTIDEYKQALVAASQDLNKASDVLTCVNLAMDNNFNTNNAYNFDNTIFNNLEIQNSVEVVVDLGSYRNSLVFDSDHKYRYLVIEPNKYTERNCIYGISATGSLPTKKDNATSLFDSSNAVTPKSLNQVSISLYDMIKELETNANKNFQYRGKNYTVYKYYFTSSYNYNTDTGKIDRIIFTLIKDINFDKYGL